MTWFTSAPVLPCYLLHQNDGIELKQCLAYTIEIADFYRMQIVPKKISARGKTGGLVRFPETRLFCFWPYHIKMSLISRILKVPVVCRSNFPQNGFTSSVIA